MRLLNVYTEKLEEFDNESGLPRYVILSHTWGKDEVSYQDILTDPDVSKKDGYRKIRKTCEKATVHGIKYAWIDTCCINKASSAELSEAINSMFRWYSHAEVCYAYLSDVPNPPVQSTELRVSDGIDEPDYLCDSCDKLIGVRYKCMSCEDVDFCEQCIASGGSHGHRGHRIVLIPRHQDRYARLAAAPAFVGKSLSGEATPTVADIEEVTLDRVVEDNLRLFAQSRWFRRGWTLQELLAPHELLFYNEDWVLIGSLDTLLVRVCKATGIDEEVLRRTTPISQLSIATRMSWMAHRATTRPEDKAYSLLGIFNVNLPLLYGEGGERAFFRLQEEIIKVSSDHSIFAWNYNFAETSGSLLAWSPLNFLNGAQIVQDHDPTRDNSYSLTNSGLRITLPVLPGEKNGDYLAVLNCRLRHDYTKVLTLKLQTQGSQYYREGERVFHVTTRWRGRKMFFTGINRPESRLKAVDMATHIADLAMASKIPMTIARHPGVGAVSSSSWRVSKAWCRIDNTLTSSGLTICDAYPREHWSAQGSFLALPNYGSLKHQMDGGLLFSHPLLTQGAKLAVCFACKQSRICPAVLMVRRPSAFTLEDICSWLELETVGWFAEKARYLPDHGLVRLSDTAVMQFDMAVTDVVGEMVLSITFSAAQKVDYSWLATWENYAETVRSTIAAKMMFSLP
ncbi:hypothetical protein LTR85_007745 [Meristemomyces frigidus]|nr:hypothetical protein LTR85_007745 [Meristemomyces frigidus]